MQYIVVKNVGSNVKIIAVNKGYLVKAIETVNLA